MGRKHTNTLLVLNLFLGLLALCRQTLVAIAGTDEKLGVDQTMAVDGKIVVVINRWAPSRKAGGRRRVRGAKCQSEPGYVKYKKTDAGRDGPASLARQYSEARTGTCNVPCSLFTTKTGHYY